MMEAVPTADVIITNPTHYAVALRYQDGLSNAPIVVAKGQDWIALKIREVAKANDVPIFEAPPLARALHGMAKLNQEIPADLYEAVAQVLAYIYQLKTITKSKANSSYRFFHYVIRFGHASVDRDAFSHDGVATPCFCVGYSFYF
jgi:flagellar biosynthetic protein FlhB